LGFAGNVIVVEGPWQILGGSVTGRFASLRPRFCRPEPIRPVQPGPSPRRDGPLAQNTQPVSLAQVPRLAIGLQLPCAVDPADPSRRFVVDWDRIAG